MKSFPPGMDRAPAPIPNYVNARQVDASTAENIAVPSSAKFARLTSLTAFYLSPDGTAAAPTGDVADGTASILVPAATAGQSPMFDVEGVSNLSVKSSSGTIIVHCEFWS